MEGGGETTAAATTTMEARGLKKGPWTATEDAILTEYVRKHGEGNWNAVQKNSGLLRCGKSCRLRWANHLRPNLKKGSFTPDEEKIIIDLHAKLGNKWARMASQLPGRTDNEIKNYWNTRMKRRQRAGLPLYPQGIKHHQQGNIDNDDEFEFEFTSFQFQNQDHHHQNMIQYTNSSNTSSSSSSFSSSSSQPSKRFCPDPLIPTNIPVLNQISSDSPVNFHMFSLYNNNSLDHKDNNHFGFSIPLSSSSSSNEFCNPNHILEFISTENSDTNNTNKNHDIDAMSYSSLLMGGPEMRQTSSFPLGLDNTVLELPSNQTTPTHLFNNGVNLDPPAGNSGLLDALLEESQALSRGGNFKDNIRVSSSDQSEVQDKRVKMEFENRLINHQNSSHHSSFGTNPNFHNKYNEPTMVKAMEDDDDLLMSLLNNFPSTTPLPDWYQSEASYLTPPSEILNGNHQGNGRVEPTTALPPSSGVDPMASLGSCYWSNMPSIC